MNTTEILVLGFGLVLTILNIVERIILFKDKLNKPHLQHETRISTLEVEVRDLRNQLTDDSERIKDLEEGTKVLMKSIGALLSHGIDGNNTEEMVEAKSDLNEYLYDRH